ncbi:MULTISPECIES: hypothetical protein [unclassified Lentimicrobium]|uniref:hypothetical protein n=1 Tax=unclassified Lentimicrobium TaxID=2677434 RepID=UPI0015521789|nr:MULTISPECIES: hypothetical protein [unclassified Lentimicrobium]NPD47326.1 hypothetical protein [Lentimicrobium sp. S6]NPD85355.1 hypothetical protein [Lentimicrobium sp. L6]
MNTNLIFKELSHNSVIEPEVLSFLLKNDLIVDGASGGIVLGDSHDEGGIFVIHLTEEGECKLTYELEGFEFLMNPFGTEEYLRELLNINKESKNKLIEFENYEIPNEVAVVDARTKNINGVDYKKVLILSKNPQMVLNKHSTLKYLKRLNEINYNSWPKNETLNTNQNI